MTPRTLVGGAQSSDHPHGKGQRARGSTRETAQVRPGDIVIEITHTPPLDTLWTGARGAALTGTGVGKGLLHAAVNGTVPRLVQSVTENH